MADYTQQDRSYHAAQAPKINQGLARHVYDECD